MRLINIVKPFLMESLESFMSRLGRANYYEETSWYKDIIPLNHSHSKLNMLSDLLDYQVLSDMTGMDKRDIYLLTLHRFSQIYNNELYMRYTDNPDYTFWEETIHRNFVNNSGTSCKICPYCWNESGAYYLHWSLRQITTCSIHKNLLVHIPESRKTLLNYNKRKLQPLFKDDLCYSESIDINNHEPSMELSIFLDRALGINASKGFPPLPLNHPLSHLSFSTILHFFLHGRKFLNSLFIKNYMFSDRSLPFKTKETVTSTPRKYSIIESHNILIEMWGLIKNWPDSFYMLMEQIVNNEDTSLSGKTLFPNWLEETFPSSDKWIWLHQGWESFMQTKIYTDSTVYPWLRQYRKKQPGQNNLPVLLSQREAAKELGVSESTLKQLIDEGKIRTIPAPDREKQRLWKLIDPASVVEMKIAHSHYMNLKNAAIMVGISKDQVIELTKAGLIEAESGPLIDGKATWQFSSFKINNFLNRLLGEVPLRPFFLDDPTKFYSFKQVQKIMSGIGFKFIQLVLDIQSGRLHSYRKSDDLLFSSLYFIKDAITYYLVASQKSRGIHLISSNEVRKRLHCTYKTLDQLAKSNLLAPSPGLPNAQDIHWYNTKDVDIFLEKYINCKQAAEILTLNVLTVQRWVRLGYLKPIMGPNITGNHRYLFDKSALIQWWQERLTFGATQELLGVSKATLDRWVREGRLKPITDMIGKQRWFTREEVQQLLESRSAQLE